MGRGRHLLTALQVSGATLEGDLKRRYLSDGAGLYLVLTLKTGAAASDAQRPADRTTKSWVFRYRSRLTGKLTELGLGSLDDVSLAKARTKAAKFRDMLSDGRDPRSETEAARASARVEVAKALTFDEAATQAIEAKKGEWKNAKHANQWTNTLATYASPIIGHLPVASIDLALVQKVLTPIWSTKTETATRVRQRIEAVLAWATVSGFRKGDNPARWDNHLDQVFARPSKLKKSRRRNQPALAYGRIGAFVQALRGQGGTASLALEFAILTAARTGEVLGATPGEFDLKRGLWTIPAARMKAEKEHTVPLSARVLEIVKQLHSQKSPWLFAGGKKGEPLSDAAMLAVIKRMDARDAEAGGWKDPKGERIVPHGFRSTFRDWAGETTHFPKEVIENALAHQLKDKAEAAYSRGTQLAKRKALMDAWQSYCDKPSEPLADNIVPIRAEIG